jgi:hypothetical protein
MNLTSSPSRGFSNLYDTRAVSPFEEICTILRDTLNEVAPRVYSSSQEASSTEAIMRAHNKFKYFLMLIKL